ncbi:MAG: glutathione S-transferase family protein [Beijerinckiaceae bacterium]
MKLYDSALAPNPRRVRFFLAEKGIELPKVQVDLAKLAQKEAEFTSINPMQRIPALVLADGTVIAESVAICRYFEELQPEPNLFGEGPLGKALVEMWQRRAEFQLLLPVANAFRHSHPAMKNMEVPQFPEFAETNRPKAVEFVKFLDSELAGRPFIAGESFSIADITVFVATDFMKPARISLPPDLSHFADWYARVAARPSAIA